MGLFLSLFLPFFDLLATFFLSAFARNFIVVGLDLTVICVLEPFEGLKHRQFVFDVEDASLRIIPRALVVEKVDPGGDTLFFVLIQCFLVIALFGKVFIYYGFMVHKRASVHLFSLVFDAFE